MPSDKTNKQRLSEFIKTLSFLFQGDLAARNVLLTYDLKAKVADFGLSLLYTNSSQNFGRHEGVIPYRWSAYEVIENRVAVIEKSDVWSFGVYVWELFSLCYDAPYTSMTYLEVKKFLHEDSQRLEKPSLCPQFLYDMMLHCWLRSYQLRPSFQELKNQLELFETDGRTLENVHVHDHEEHDYDQPTYEAYFSSMVTNMMYGLEDCYEESPEAEVSYSYADETIQAISFAAESYNLQHNLLQVDSEKIDQVSSRFSDQEQVQSQTLMVDKRSGWVKFDDFSTAEKQTKEQDTCQPKLPLHGWTKGRKNDSGAGAVEGAARSEESPVAPFDCQYAEVVLSVNSEENPSRLQDQIKYTDISPHLKTSMNKEPASTKKGNSITYANVDFEKTAAFNQTKKDMERKRSDIT